MDVEIFFHGVPKGQDYRGIESERSFFSTFYNSIPQDETVKLLVNIRNIRGISYYYYHYLVNNSIADCDGRPGSYFGVSIRMDAFCSDIHNMYRILDYIYHLYVVNDILKWNNGRLEYSVHTFTLYTDTFETIEKEILRLIQKAFYQESFISLGELSHGNESTPCFYLYDCTPEAISAAIRNYRSIAVSPYFQSESEKKCLRQNEERLQSIKEDNERNIRRIEQEYKNKTDQLARSLQLANDQKEKIENDLRSVRNDNYRLRQGTNPRIGQLIDQIKEPIRELAGSFKKYDDSKQTSTLGLVKAVLPIVNTVLIIIGIVLLFFVSCNLDQQTKSLDKITNIPELNHSCPNLDDNNSLMNLSNDSTTKCRNDSIVDQ